MRDGRTPRRVVGLPYGDDENKLDVGSVACMERAGGPQGPPGLPSGQSFRTRLASASQYTPRMRQMPFCVLL